MKGIRKINRKVYNQYCDIENQNLVTIYGSNRWIKIEYVKPEWSKHQEASFRYQGRRYWLSEFTARFDATHNPTCPLHEFEGFHADSFFSGILVKVGQNAYGDEAVKAFTFIS